MDAYEKYLEATLNESDSLSPEESPEEQEGDDELIVDDEEEEFNARKERKKREPGKTERILSQNTYKMVPSFTGPWP